MVQIGDIHLGKAESAIPPGINIMEASLLWDALMSRYKCVEETQFYYKYAHDNDFKALLKFGVNFLSSQADELEKQMVKYQLPMPKRPPLSFNDPENNRNIFSDEFMLRQIFEGCQTFIDYFARVSRSVIANDQLRKVFVNFLTDELTLFDKLCKFAKLKGWIEVPPPYHS